VDRGPYDRLVADGTAVMVFLFTDVEGSTQLWERHPRGMSAGVPSANAVSDGCSRGSEYSHPSSVMRVSMTRYTPRESKE
jgi:hypothetical protein